MRNIRLFRILVVSFSMIVGAAAPTRHTLVAFVKQIYDGAGNNTGSEIWVSDSLAGPVEQLTNNGFRKTSPQWSPDGKRLAYLEDVSPNIRLPQLVVIGRKGEVQAIQRVLPDQVPGDQVTSLTPRGISIVDWAGEDRIAIEGDFNPWVCMYMLINTFTGKASKHQLGTCGTFQRSPDGLHVLEEQAIRRNVDPSVLTMEGEPFYPAAKSEKRVLDDPRWSPDSKTVAVLEHTGDKGTRNLALIPLSGRTRRIELPSSADGATIQWMNGSWIAIGSETAVDASSGRVTRLPEDLATKIRADDALEAVRAEAAAHVKVPVRSSLSDVWIAR